MIANAMPSIVHSAGGEPVDAVGEVDDVHQPDQPDHGQNAALVRELQARPMNGIVTSVTTTPASTAITAAAIWPSSLTAGRRLDVVDRADERDQAGAGDHPPGVARSRWSRACRAPCDRA